MNYEKDLYIDDSALDIEWLDQSMLFMKYARYLAETRRTADEAKQYIEIVKAELDKAVRENPEKFKLDKVTDKAIDAIIATDKKYKDAYQVYLEAKYEADMASSAVSAFNMRKEALENLVKLNGQQYFSGPKVPRDIHWEREEKAKKLDSKIGNKLNRNK
jgi:DNA repair ATPase RecN